MRMQEGVGFRVEGVRVSCFGDECLRFGARAV